MKGLALAISSACSVKGSWTLAGWCLMTEHSDRWPEDFYLCLSLVWLQRHCDDCSGNNHEEVCLTFCQLDCILPVWLCEVISENGSKSVVLECCQRWSKFVSCVSSSSLQCILLGAGLLTPVCHMTRAERMHQAESKHLTWVLLSSIVFHHRRWLHSPPTGVSEGFHRLSLQSLVGNKWHFKMVFFFQV